MGEWRAYPPSADEVILSGRPYRATEKRMARMMISKPAQSRQKGGEREGRKDGREKNRLRVDMEGEGGGKTENEDRGKQKKRA